jgi:hypothetical protein
MFIPDPDLDILPIPDSGVKKAPDPESGSATQVLWIWIIQIPLDTDSEWPQRP